MKQRKWQVKGRELRLVSLEIKWTVIEVWNKYLSRAEIRKVCKRIGSSICWGGCVFGATKRIRSTKWIRSKPRKWIHFWFRTARWGVWGKREWAFRLRRGGSRGRGFFLFTRQAGLRAVTKGVCTKAVWYLQIIEDGREQYISFKKPKSIRLVRINH